MAEGNDFRISLREDGGDLKIDIPQASPRVSTTSCVSELSMSMMPTMSDWRQRAVMIENVPKKYLAAVLDRMENRSREGGRVESHYTDRLDSQKLVVVFAHCKVAQAMLALRTFDIVDATFNIRSLPYDYQLPSVSLPPSEISDTIKVFDVLTEMPLEHLNLYFENFKRANGGPTLSVQLIAEKKQAIIQYKESKDAVAVARKRIHSLMNHSMAVVLLEPDLNLDCHAILVSGIDWNKITEEFLNMYFENTGRSGGDEILETVADKKRGQAVITFSSGKVAKDVFERGKAVRHVLYGVPLHVEMMKPHIYPPAFDNEVEQNRLIVKRLPLGVTLSELSKYMESVSNCRVVGWVLSSKPSTVMLEFDGEPDYGALRKKVNCIPFRGQMISIQKMPFTTFIHVSNLSAEEAVNSVLDYFAGRIGLGRGIRCEQKTEKSVILQVHHHSVAKGILSTKHVLNGRTLNVDLWSKEIKCLLPVNASKDPVNNCLRMLKIRCTQSQLCCIQNSPSVRDEIEKKLKDNSCVLVWPLAVGELDVQLELTEDGVNKDQLLWPDDCKDLLQNCLNDLIYQKFTTTPDVWRKLKDIIQDHSHLDYSLDEEKSEICAFGFSQSVKEYVKNIKEQEGEIKRQLDKEKELQSMKVETLTTLKAHQIQYIQVAGIVDEIKSIFPRVTVEAGNQMVSLLGREEDLIEAKLHIYSSLNNVDSSFIDLTECLTELFTTEPTAGFIRDYILQNKVHVIIQRALEKPGITVYGVDSELRNAEVLISEFAESLIEVNADAKNALKSSEWPQFVNALKEDYRFLNIKPTTDACIVACRSDLLDSVKHELNVMFGKYATVEYFISMKQSHTELLSQQTEVQKLDKKLRECSVGGELKKVLEASGSSGFAVKGQREEVESARKRLETLAKSVIERQLELNRPGVSALMQSSEGKEFVRDLQAKVSGIVKVTTGESADFSALSDHRVGIRCRNEIVNGCELILEIGNLMDVATDAIVNPCNPHIELSHGLGREIVRMGGKEIELECNDRIKNNGIVLPGKVFVSKANKLPCDAIIHAVEPTVFDSSAVNVYKSTIESILSEAIARNFGTIVFPLHFGVLFRRELLFSTIKDFLQNNNTATTLKKIRFCDNDIALLVKFEKQWKMYESSNQVSSGAVSAGVTSVEPGFSHLSLTTPEGIAVKFFKGSICDLKVDAIVNSTAKNLSLGSGGISKAILSASGPEIQKECQTKAPNGLGQFGDIFCTKSYKLTNCRAVYHGAAVQWDNAAAGPCVQILRKFVSQALTQADRDAVTSIAFPAIGSGTLKVPHDTVTDVLFDEIVNFSKSYPNTCLKTIYTVAFNKNLPCVAAFEKKFQTLQSKYRPTPTDDGTLIAIQSRSLRTYNEIVSFAVTSLSQNTVQLIQNELKKYVDNASDKKEFEIQNAMTDEQLERIDLLQTIDCVRIMSSDSLITIEGLKNDVISAAEKFKYITKNS